MWPCVTLDGPLGLYRLGTMRFRDARRSPAWPCVAPDGTGACPKLSYQSSCGSRRGRGADPGSEHPSGRTSSAYLRSRASGVPNGFRTSAKRNLRHSLVSRPCFIHSCCTALAAAQRHEEFASIRTRVHLPNPLDTTRACYAASQGTQPYSDQGDRSMGPTFVLLLLLASAGAQASRDEAAIIAGHEQARKAHLTGNADLLASGIAEKFIEAGRGKFAEKTREQVRQMFTEYFKVAKYSVWRDTFSARPLHRAGRARLC